MDKTCKLFVSCNNICKSFKRKKGNTGFPSDDPRIKISEHACFDNVKLVICRKMSRKQLNFQGASVVYQAALYYRKANCKDKLASFYNIWKPMSFGSREIGESLK